MSFYYYHLKGSNTDVEYHSFFRNDCKSKLLTGADLVDGCCRPDVNGVPLLAVASLYCSKRLDAIIATYQSSLCCCLGKKNHSKSLLCCQLDISQLILLVYFTRNKDQSLQYCYTKFEH